MKNTGFALGCMLRLMGKLLVQMPAEAEGDPWCETVSSHRVIATGATATPRSQPQIYLPAKPLQVEIA